MDKFTDVKEEYEIFLEALKEYLPDVNEDEVFSYYTAVMMKIWGSNLLYSPDYATLLYTISGEEFTMEQIVTAMSCCTDPERELLVPDFYVDLCRSDKETGNHGTVMFIVYGNSLFVASAMINGDFTTGEAACLSSIMDGLIKRARQEGLKGSSLPDNSDRITELNEESYLKNDALLKAARDRKLESVRKAASEMDEEPVTTLPLTINIRLTTDDSSPTSSLVQAKNASPGKAVSEPKKDEEETMDSLLKELDDLVGLKNVKQDVHSLMNFIKVAKIREKRGMKVPTISYHLVFTGNPGTGKTTVARLVGRLYYHMGILPKGQLVETDRSALVAGYLGQTAIKTQEVIQEAMGGVLFIDEAYSLAGDPDDSYGREAIETILKAMEDHRDELVVIVAGYTDLMRRFISSNPGLSSRFSKYFEFPDYPGDELVAIFCRFCEKNGYVLDPGAEEMLREKLDLLYEGRDAHFGNARTARNIFEKAINAQADRLAVLDDLSDLDLQTLNTSDIASAVGGAV